MWGKVFDEHIVDILPTKLQNDKTKKCMNIEMHKVWLIKCAHLLIKVYYLYNNLIIMKLKIYLICFWKQSN